jgi:hypothetical protein
MNSPKIIPFSYENMFSLTNCFLRIGPLFESFISITHVSYEKE